MDRRDNLIKLNVMEVKINGEIGFGKNQMGQVNENGSPTSFVDPGVAIRYPAALA